MKKEITKEELERLFIEQHLTIKEISEKFNCDRQTIRRRLQKYGLKEGNSYKPPKEKIDPLIETKQLIKELYLSGKSCLDIAKIVNLSERTISYHLHKMNVPIRPNKKVNQSEFEEMWSKGMSDEDIANKFNVSINTIKSFRTNGENTGKFKRTSYFSQLEKKLSDEQEQFILGSLLGDLNIAKPRQTDHGEVSRLAIVHSIKQEELFKKKVEILGEFMVAWKLSTPSPDKRTGKVYQTFRGNTHAHKVFADIWHLAYPNGKKVITKEFLNRIHSPIALAYWFMDDGCYRGTIATNCFSESEINLLIDWMQSKWSITCTKQQNIQNGCIQYVLHVSENSRFNFEKLIFPYLVPSMYYKLKYLENLK